MELTLLLLSLAAGVQSWPQIPDEAGNLRRENSLSAIPYTLASRALPVVEESGESMGTLPVRRAKRQSDEIPGFVGFHVEKDEKRGLVDEWLGNDDPNAPVHASDNSRRSLPSVDESESMGTLPVANFGKRGQVDDWLQDEDPNAPVHASRSLPVVDESESFGTLPVENFLHLPIVHRERPGLVGRSVEIALENRSDVAYYAQLSIGTPPQKVYAQLDTGSFELWVNPDCEKLRGGDKTFCEAVGEYDASLSKTATLTGETKQLNYGIGAAEIEYVKDDIALSDTAKLEGVQFGVATKTEDQFAGILGLGYGNGAVVKYDNFIDNLVKQGVTKTAAYGVALGSKAEGGGFISFGAVDTSKYGGKLAALSVIPADRTPDRVPRYWVNMKSMSLTGSDGKSKTWSGSTMPVFLDTGATLTLVPPTLAASIAADFGATKLDSNGFYTVDCEYINQEGTVDFEFEGVTIKVPYKEVIREVRANTMCYLGIVPSERYALLGDTFMRSVYAVFDQDSETVFLAQYNNCGSALKTINKSSDIEGMTGVCGASDNDGKDDEDKDDKDEDNKDKDEGDKDEDDKDEAPKSTTVAKPSVTTFVTSASGSATTVTKSIDTTSDAAATTSATTATTETSSPSSSPDSSESDAEDNAADNTGSASPPAESEGSGDNGGSGAGALTPLGLLFSAGVGIAMLMAL